MSSPVLTQSVSVCALVTSARPNAALALVPMICLHPGNLLAPWKMPQRISSAVTACGGSVCESPPQQAPTGPLIPRVANSFWLAISQPSLSAAIAAGAEAVLQLERVCVRVWPFVCPWLEGITEYVSGRYSQRYTKKAMLWLIKGGRGYCVDLLIFSFSFFFFGNSVHPDKATHQQTGQ